MNTAVITKDGQLLMQGSNFGNQLCCQEDIWKLLKFFPEFKPIEFPVGSKVKQVAIGEVHIYALVEIDSKTKVYGWGQNVFGQLFKDDEGLVH